MDNNLFAVDKIEEQIVILENIKTKEIKEIFLNLLPNDIHEGSIVRFCDNSYILEMTEEEKRRQEILERFKNLRKKA